MRAPLVEPVSHRHVEPAHCRVMDYEAAPESCAVRRLIDGLVKAVLGSRYTTTPCMSCHCFSNCPGNTEALGCWGGREGASG